MRKKNSSDREKLLKLEAEGREFSNFKKYAYSDVSIKNIDILPNWQYIANTADLAQEQYS